MLHAIFILTQSANQAVETPGSTPKVPLLLPPKSVPLQHSPVSAYRQIRVCQTLQQQSESLLRGPLHQPSHSLKEQMHH